MKAMVRLIAVCTVLIAGCGRQGKAPPPPEYNQVTVDLPKLQQTFMESGPEAKQSLAMVQRDLRYGDYPKALFSLDQLAQNPGITEAQKKVVSEVIEQVKKVIAQAPAAPAGQ